MQHLAIKRNVSESVLMKWANLEPIIQSEVSQKEKYKYCILMHNNRTNKWLRNTMDLKEAEDIERCQEYIEEVYKKGSS